VDELPCASYFVDVDVLCNSGKFMFTYMYIVTKWLNLTCPVSHI